MDAAPMCIFLPCQEYLSCCRTFQFSTDMLATCCFVSWTNLRLTQMISNFYSSYFPLGGQFFWIGVACKCQSTGCISFLVITFWGPLLFCLLYYQGQTSGNYSSFSAQWSISRGYPEGGFCFFVLASGSRFGDVWLVPPYHARFAWVEFKDSVIIFASTFPSP